jgi:hypothetical protein
MAVFEYEYKTVEDAMRAVDLGVEDTLKDQPDLKEQEDSIYHDICQSIMIMCPPEVARELARRTGVEYIGW